MTQLTLGLVVGAVLMALGAGLAFIGAVCSGQFDDVEEAKFQMLREDEEGPQ